MDKIRRLIASKIDERRLTYKVVSLEMGRNHAYLQQYIERGIPRELKEADRARLSEILDIPEEELGGMNRPPAEPSAPISDLIPEIDVVAGMGGGGLAALEISNHNGITFAKEVVRDHWKLPEWKLNSMGVHVPHVAAFPCKGDSMSPTINDGDVVFVDTRHRIPSPPGVYALADEFGGVVVKRLDVTSRPGADIITIRISSDNPRHITRELTLDEIQIVGRYIGRFTTD
ncbi:S24 family peptidase [Rhizobium lusitanum]|uniref:S24 family peptidase n=1 Tax=Rhizobium lusitanum TaxID=293958 RepID=UPI00195C2F92|nr:S24 family peptidase [Rhizobium lusitanum]MBM7048461.1 S24 family peptidase [Rhizobium lusitanum]